MSASLPSTLASPWLVLAPHLRYPTRNGADILADRTARHLSGHVPHVDLVASDRVLRFVDGALDSDRRYENAVRSRSLAAARTIVLRSHFLAEKFNTPAFAVEAARAVASGDYGAVLCSYVSTAAIGGIPFDAAPECAYFIATHNDEVKWFEDRARTGPLPARLAAAASRRWLLRRLPAMAGAFTFLHVTEEDQAGFGAIMPGHRSLVVPVGADTPERPSPPLAAGSPPRLLFVGSLGVAMNGDALEHFATRYAPALRKAFGDELRVDVAGSAPTRRVVARCRQDGWSLHADISDEALQVLYEKASFAVLPFAYATGAKLKLVGALSRGVPALCTPAAAPGGIALAAPSVVSDDPGDWIAAVATMHERGLTASDRERISSAAGPFLWPNIIRTFTEALRQP